MNKRNVELDILKGCGILLMIIGHCNFPYYLLRVIFTFHMPLFFLISGFLYKEKPLVKRIKSNMKKIILPYIFTCFVVWLYFIIYENDYMWGLSIFTANGSLPVFNYNNLKVGPLWFLVCYFVAAIYFHYLLKIRKEWYRIVLLMALFAMAMIYKHYFNLLPLDILNAVPATIFLYLGYELRNKSFLRLCFNNKTCLVIGLCVGIICCLKGDLSMASLNYKLWYLQFFGALYCCFILHRLLIFLKGGRILSFIGRNSLALLCIHSVDWLMGITDNLAKGIVDNYSLYPFVQLLLKLLFVAVVYLLISHITFLKSIYSISK